MCTRNSNERFGGIDLEISLLAKGFYVGGGPGLLFGIMWSRYTESTAVGSQAFARETKERLGIRAIGREVIGDNGSYELREPEAPYEANFNPKNRDLRQEKTFYWDISV